MTHDASGTAVEPVAGTPTGPASSWDYGHPVLDCCIAYNRYGGYVVPVTSAHRPASVKILAGRVYEPQTIELLRGECGSGDIVHAGTFFGDFLPALSQGLAPGARVFAFEPNPESFRCASMTLTLNAIENVELTRAGLGARPGHAVMATTREDGSARGGSSRILQEGDPSTGSGEIRIPIRTVDQSVPCERTVSILQLDLEGYERFALEGAMATIRRCRPLIIVETRPEPRWVSENLGPLGYRRAERVHYNTVFRIT